MIKKVNRKDLAEIEHRIKRYETQQNHRQQEELENNPLLQYSTSELKAELRRRKRER